MHRVPQYFSDSLQMRAGCMCRGYLISRNLRYGGARAQRGEATRRAALLQRSRYQN